MTIIKELESKISDEIEDIEGYAKMAVSVKADRPGLAQVLYNISMQEDAHQAALHAEVVKIIEEHRRTHGEPPAAMMAVYDYVHKKHIEELAEARRYQDIYKTS